MRRGSSRLGRWIAAAALLIGCEAAGPGAEAPPGPARGPRRALEAEGRLSTAEWPRVQIGTETRTVLGSVPRLIARWQEPVVLDGESGPLDIRAALPDSLAAGERVLVVATASVEDPDRASRPEGELETMVAHRRTFRSAPRVVAPIEGEVAASIPIPENAALDGLTALIDVTVRPLPAADGLAARTPDFDLIPGDRLRFGFGIEEDAIAAGWPAVVIRAALVEAATGERRTVFERRVDPVEVASDRGWHDVEVALDLEGPLRGSFAFDVRAEGDAPGTYAVFSNPRVLAAASERGDARPWNVILISLDTLRARSVSAYGPPRRTTPVIDRRVAAEGSLITQAMTPFAYTPPSHMSMLTGLEVCAHGVESRHQVLAPDRVTLAEALRAAGYHTAAFTENGYVVAGSGFARGFDTYYELLSEERAAPGFADETFAKAERWLGTAAEEPFFLFVHTYQVHGPYTPPDAYASLFVDEPVPGVPEKHRAALDDYEREIRYTDDLLASFLDALDSSGLSDRTLLIVTSDHGEQFGEHFFTGHGFDVHDEAMLVPMILRAPGLVARGRRVDVQVGLMDLAPTVLELLGLPPLPEVQGRSFANLVAAQPDADLGAFEERPLVGKASHSRSVRTRAFKYIEGTAKNAWHKLYDLEVDPLEKSNVAEARPEQVAEARRYLAEHTAACETFERQYGAASDSRLEGHHRPGWMINRDEIERKLRSLGYVE